MVPAGIHSGGVHCAANLFGAEQEPIQCVWRERRQLRRAGGRTRRLRGWGFRWMPVVQNQVAGDADDAGCSGARPAAPITAIRPVRRRGGAVGNGSRGCRLRLEIRRGTGQRFRMALDSLPWTERGLGLPGTSSPPASRQELDVGWAGGWTEVGAGRMRTVQPRRGRRRRAGLSVP